MIGQWSEEMDDKIVMKAVPEISRSRYSVELD